MRLPPLSAYLILVSLPAWGAPGLDVRPDVGFMRTDEIATLAETIPNFDKLQCFAQCDGGVACPQYPDMKTCLTEGEADGCFWSCQ